MGVIKLLGASVADQIAAGEVVNRPSSVVKELMENAVDAGAKNVTLIIQEAGHILVQVMDDGCGMSPEDAVTAFQRHATSKIQSADDLFKLTTFGFRGEALPSIASVAQVELRTRREEDDLGIEIQIAASIVTSQKEVHCPKGSTIAVRNLFFNTPARRKFLKSPAYERRVIFGEFEKIAMANPSVTFTLQSDSEQPIVYRPATLRQRVAEIVKRQIDKSLLPVDLDTPTFSLKGWISSPSLSGTNPTKNSHFFVNGRFMRNQGLQKSVAQAYGRMLPQGNYPYFYLFIDIDPSQIDVNIHPTKTEIKFEDEQLIWQMVNSAIRKSLGSASIAPSLDFANPVSIEIPTYTPLAGHEIRVPRTTSGRDYNPFTPHASGASFGGNAWNPAPEFDPEQVPFRENLPQYLIDGSRAPASESTHSWVEVPSEAFSQQQIDLSTHAASALQFNSRYLIHPSSSGLLLIDYPRAMERVAFEKLNESFGHSEHAQLELIPQQIELSNSDASTLLEHSTELSNIGLELSDLGNGNVAVYAIPASLVGKISATEIIEELLDTLGDKHPTENIRTILVSALARSATRAKTRPLTDIEKSHLITELLACNEPTHTPAGLPIISILTTDEIEKRLKRR